MSSASAKSRLKALAESEFDAKRVLTSTRRRVRRAYVAAAALAVLLIVAALAFFAHEKRALEQSAQARVQLYAKVLEDHTTRVLSNVDVSTLSMVQAIAAQPPSQSGASIQTLLVNASKGQAYLRSVALVAQDGTILGSSFAGDRGGRVSWAILAAPQPDAKSMQLISPRAGRSLTDLQLPSAGSNAPLVLPVMRAVRAMNGETVCLIALINIDFIATQFERLIDDQSIRTVLSTYSGDLLFASMNLPLSPSSRLSSIPVFNELLLQRDHGNYAGQGVSGVKVFGAYRAARVLPLVVIVEESHAMVVDKLDQELIWVGAGTLLLLMLLLGSTILIRNSAGRDEAMAARLQSSYSQSLALESRNESILYASLDAVILADQQGRVMDFNPAAQKMFGYQLAEAKGQALDALILPNGDFTGERFEFDRFLAKGDSKELNRLRQIDAGRRDGSRFPIEFTVVRVPMSGVTFYTVTIRDISERRQAEKRLGDSEQRWKLALEATGDGVWDWDVKNDSMVYSPHLLAMLGYGPGDLSARREVWSGLLHPMEVKATIQAMSNHLNGVSPTFAIEGRMLCKNGSWKWIHARGMVVERDSVTGAPLRMVGTNTDVSERKSAEVERALLFKQSRRLASELQRARETEIDVGARIQKSLLLTPQTRPVSDLWVTCFNQTSQGVDGDFVEIICPTDYAIDIVVGDVMGKGVNAALMGAAVKMQLSRSMIELMTGAARTGELPLPADVVRSVHVAVTPHLQALESFVTLCYVRIDTRANTITWVGCGHEEPLLLRKDSKPLTLTNQHPPIGVLEDAEFAQETVVMHAHDSLFLHSDGVTDAILSNGERLGHDKLYAALIEGLQTHQAPAAVLHSTRRGLFSDGVRFTDDLTMVLATRSGRGQVSRRVEVECTLASIQPLRHLINEVGLQGGLDEGNASLFTVAAVEAFTNIVRHAKGRLENAPIEIVTNQVGDILELEMIYLADSFTPPVERITPDLDDFPEGGFGLGIIRNVCDSVHYGHKAGVNTIRLSKSVRREEFELVSAD